MLSSSQSGRGQQMNARIKGHVIKYKEAKGWGYDGTEDDLICTIRDAKRVHREEVGQHRWWTDYFYVVEIDGMFIGYLDAETTSDISAEECGCEFDPATIREVRPVEKTVTVYENVTEGQDDGDNDAN